MSEEKIQYEQSMRFTEETKDIAWRFVTCSKTAATTLAGDPALIIYTLEGQKTCRLGNWILRMKDGSFCVATQNEFDTMYQQIPKMKEIFENQSISVPETMLDCAVNVDDFLALGIQGAETLFDRCCKVCRNTGDCSPDCPDYPAEEVIELLKKRIVELQGMIKP